MNDLYVMGEDCPFGKLSNKNRYIYNKKPIQLDEQLDSTSLLVGFGDSCDLGANSVASRWELDGLEPQRVPNKSRTSWVRAGRLIREHISFRAIAWRFLRSAPSATMPAVEMTRREGDMKKGGLGIKRRERIAYALYRVLISLTPASYPRAANWGSHCISRHFPRSVGLLNSRLIASCIPVDPIKVEANTSLGLKRYKSCVLCPEFIKILFRIWLIRVRAFLVYFLVFLVRTLSSVLSLPKPYLEPSLALGKKHRLIGPFFGFLISFHMILFCVCLAHARQQGLGTPVATGVAFQSNYAVTGKVMSVTDSKPLEGATLSIQGKQTKGRLKI